MKKIKWPSKKQWAQIFKVLTKKERMALLILLVFFLGSFLFLIIDLYLKNTEIHPARGGKYTEGIAGVPRFINPIYAQGSDVDRDLVELIFSGLMKYDNQGKIVPDLAQNMDIDEEGKIYEVTLKENLSWHDGKPLTADDVVFTIKTIQNPDYKSPLRGNYLGVEVEKISDNKIRFKLKTPYSGFLERLTFKILPKHIWQEISAQNFLLSDYNLKPIGSGIYQFKKLEQDKSKSVVSLELVSFEKKPYISKLIFRFFKNEGELIEAARRGEIEGFSIASPGYFNLFKGKFNEFSLSLPRYFALFFNPDKSRFLAEKEIREGLNYATNKAEIVEKIFLGRAETVDSPLLPEIYGYESPSKVYEFNPEKVDELFSKAGLEKKEGKWVKVAKEEIVEFKSRLEVGSKGKEVTALQTCLARDPEVYPEGKITGYFGSQTKQAVIKFQEKYKEEILEPWGYKSGTGTVGKTTQAKLNEMCLEPPEETPLKFSLATVEDPILTAVAVQLKTQWEALGIEIEIKTYSISQLEQDIIKPRNYEMLLFGEVLTITPDPYPFWHSSQIKDPGLNLAKYDNKKADDLLEAARTILDDEARAEKYETLQNILIQDAPCVFLYQPDYVYFVSKKIKGIEAEIIVDPSKRFSNIEDWYIRTHRRFAPPEP